jgi:hypothetical protein
LRKINSNFIYGSTNRVVKVFKEKIMKLMGRWTAQVSMFKLRPAGSLINRGNVVQQHSASPADADNEQSEQVGEEGQLAGLVEDGMEGLKYTIWAAEGIKINRMNRGRCRDSGRYHAVGGGLKTACNWEIGRRPVRDICWELGRHAGDWCGGAERAQQSEGFFYFVVKFERKNWKWAG